MTREAHQHQSDSRRSVERDITNLIMQHGMYAVIHAVIENCHTMTPNVPQRHHYDWLLLCGHLRAAEALAHEQRHISSDDSTA